MNDAPEQQANVGPREEALRALRQTLHRLWQFGGNALVGWRPTSSGIEVLTVPKIRLFSVQQAPRRVFAGARLLGHDTFDYVAQAFGI